MATVFENARGLSRRELLKRGTVGAALIIAGQAVICPQAAWGVEATALKPETMATLILLAVLAAISIALDFIAWRTPPPRALPGLRRTGPSSPIHRPIRERWKITGIARN